MLNTPTIHDDEAYAVWREARLPPHQFRKLRYRLYQLRRPTAELLDAVPENARERIANRIQFHVINLENEVRSADGSSKLVFRTQSGAQIESVILRNPNSDRTSICISSQVGCAAKCVFCATGQMAQVRNLSSNEMVDQIIQANQLVEAEGRRIRNVVFMGMGEPFHNEDQVNRTAELLFSNHHFNLSPKRTIVSTVGIPDAMLRFASRFRKTSIALSLHSANQTVRESLIPLARKYPLEKLKETLHEVANIQSDTPMMIEYLLLDGINHSDEDADRLSEFAHGLPTIINLIPFNPVTHAPDLMSPTYDEGGRFARRLRDAGHIVTFRYSMGRDVAAACGQLVK